MTPTTHRMDIGAYTEHLTSLGRSLRTIEVYAHTIRRVIAALGPLEDVSSAVLWAYTEEQPNTYSTRKLIRTAVVEYCRAVGVDEVLAGAIRVPRKPRYRCVALSEEDTRAVVKTATGWYPEGLAVLFGLYLALRATEIAQTHRDRFSDGMGWYTMTGKGSVTATLPVHPTLAAEVRAVEVDGYLFPGSNGREHVTPQAVWKWTRRVALAAGIDERVWTHRLRHTALATANDNTGDLRAVAEFARHRDPADTMVYTRTTDSKLQKVAASLNYT